MNDDFIFTSESVTAGHPDKLCDQISDAIVDAYLAKDPFSGIIAESALSSGVLFIAATYASKGLVDIPDVARQVLRDAHYPKSVFDADACAIMTSFMDHTASEYRPLDFDAMDDDEIGRVTARDQVTAFGYACDQTPALMPMPIWLAHHFAQRLASDEVRAALPYLMPDGKSQVGIEYRDGLPIRLHSIVLTASQRAEDAVDVHRLRSDLVQQVVQPVLAEGKHATDADTRIFVNPDGVLIGGGPAVHSGLTGRKTGIDTYGEYTRHSGAALSGKGPTRADRIGAYAARYAAKNVVASGLAQECEVQISYSIGAAEPVSVRVRSFGTSDLEDRELAGRIGEVFDFRIGGIVRDLRLQRLPAEHGGRFYRDLAVYGHMGRTDLDVPWERTDRASALTK